MAEVSRATKKLVVPTPRVLKAMALRLDASDDSRGGFSTCPEYSSLQSPIASALAPTAVGSAQDEEKLYDFVVG